jgi:hypothetical protein
MSGGMGGDPFRIVYELEKIHEPEILPPHAERFSNGAIIFREPSVEVCKPPGWWSRFWNGVELYAYWECAVCGNVYKLRPSGWEALDPIDTKAFKERWKR